MSVPTATYERSNSPAPYASRATHASSNHVLHMFRDAKGQLGDVEVIWFNAVWPRRDALATEGDTAMNP